MQYLDNETYLLDVLVRQGLMSTEQQKMVILKKEQQRQALMRIIRDQERERGRKRKYVREVDLVDIIVSLNLE
ncbi:MAG: hypothetical protein MUO63_06870, partial [Desulfobulbaceae bacterium]|nr:hypothetical protein [Desulfobulbaceae bacterium]